MGALGRGVVWLLGLTVLPLAALWIFFWGDDLNGWRSWGFRLTHRVISAPEPEYGPRTIQFLLRKNEDPSRAALACAHAFQKPLPSENLFVFCQGFGSQADAEQQRRETELECWRVMATQLPYSTPGQARIEVRPGPGCGSLGSNQKLTSAMNVSSI